MSIDLYTPVLDATGEYMGMEPREDGSYVWLEDHMKVVTTKDEQIECLKNMIRVMQHNPNFDFFAASEGVVE